MNTNDNWNGRSEDRREEKPPFSKIFILFNKEYDMQEVELRDAFEEFGEIENILIPKDRATGKTRGMAYVKFSLTSSAAAAIEKMHLKPISNTIKPVKVLLATHKNDKNDDTAEKCSRLFIKISKQATDREIQQYFSQFGEVLSVFILKDRASQESKGLAYVNFKSFLAAAQAFEMCEESYRPVFATPKTELKRGRESHDGFYDSPKHPSTDYNRTEPLPIYNNIAMNMPTTQKHKTKIIYVTCSPGLAETHIERLFNIIPGMVNIQYTADNYKGYCKAVVTYDNESSAGCAIERLDGYEFPSGERVTVKPEDPLSSAADSLTTIMNSFKNVVDSSSRPDLMQLADAIAQASTLLKAASTGAVKNSDHDSSYCSVPLPPVQPLASPNASVVKRCFLVFKPGPPPLSALRDAFCRFGNLIEVNAIPNKTFGFAKYASEAAAQAAIDTLHKATLCGVWLKVIEADEKPSKEMEVADVEHNSEKKRMKY